MQTNKPKGIPRDSRLGLFITLTVIVAAAIVILFFVNGTIHEQPMTPTVPKIVIVITATSSPLQTSVPTTAISTVIPTLTGTPSPQPLPTHDSKPPLAAGTTRTDAFNIVQVWVPAGCFVMGSDPKIDPQAHLEEEPAHKVCITSGYWLDQYDVTNAAFDAFVSAGGYKLDVFWSADGLAWKNSNNITGPGSQAWNNDPCTPYSNDPQQPRVCVNYYEAEAYAKWRGGRLPTEAEWEYAARGPNSLLYPWGNTWDGIRANTTESGIGKTTPVDFYKSGRSWVNAYDMAGNVFQWTADWYSGNYYASSPQDNPTGPASGQDRVVRGGFWGGNQINARSAFRYYGDYSPTYRAYGIGFRVMFTS